MALPTDESLKQGRNSFNTHVHCISGTCVHEHISPLLGEHPRIVNICLGPVTVHYRGFTVPILDQKLCAIEGFQRVYLYRFFNTKSESEKTKFPSLKVEYLENGMYSPKAYEFYVHYNNIGRNGSYLTWLATS